MSQKIIVNCSTGERTVVDLTPEELQLREDTKREMDARREEEEAAKAKRAADKASGDAKLKALGLTDDEIAAR